MDEEIVETFPPVAESPPEETEPVQESPVQVAYTQTGPLQVELVGEDDDYVYDEDYGLVVYATNPVTSATGLKGVLLDVLGNYDAIVVEHRYTTSSGSYNYVREIQPDYPWLCSAALFVALLWSVFAIGGRIICRK